jgi:hypothetical protein
LFNERWLKKSLAPGGDAAVNFKARSYKCRCEIIDCDCCLDQSSKTSTVGGFSQFARRR